jgi:cellulose biosynthesis protein BcsQ
MDLAIVNQHSETGKTAIALGLGRALTEVAQKVFIVDLDPNSDATATLGIKAKPALYDFLFREVPTEGLTLPGLRHVARSGV